MEINKLEQIIRERYNIWVNPSKHRSKLYRFVVYCHGEAIGQFKKELDAKLFIEARINYEVKEFMKDADKDKSQ